MLRLIGASSIPFFSDATTRGLRLDVAQRNTLTQLFYHNQRYVIPNINPQILKGKTIYTFVIAVLRLWQNSLIALNPCSGVPSVKRFTKALPTITASAPHSLTCCACSG